MNRALVLLMTVAFLTAYWPSAPTTVVSAMPMADKGTEELIIGLEHSWAEAIINKDAATLERLLASDFNGTSPGAHYYSKGMAISDLKEGLYVVKKMDLDEISVNVYGNTAITFTSQEEISSYGSEDVSGHYHYTNVWVKRFGRWQVVASHGSRFEVGH